MLSKNYRPRCGRRCSISSVARRDQRKMAKVELSMTTAADASSRSHPFAITPSRLFNTTSRGGTMHSFRESLRVFLGVLCVSAVSVLFVLSNATADDLQVGVAKIDVTPDYPVRLSGYFARKSE